MADIKFSCPKCGMHLVIDASAAGMEVNCPSCGQRIVVPGVSPPGSQPAAPTVTCRVAWRRAVAIAGTGLVVVVLAVIAVVLLRGRSASQSLKAGVQAKLDAIRAAGEPVTLEELNNYYPEPPAGENAAELYAQAFAALTADDPKSPAFLSKNQRAVALLLQAAERKSCRYPLDLREGDSLRSRHLQGIKKSAQLLQAEAIAQAKRDRTDAATKAILAGVRLARSLDNEPIAISKLVEFACLALAIQGLEQALAQTRFTEAHLARVQATLREAESAVSFRHILIGERAFTLAWFQAPPEEWATLWSSLDKDRKPSMDHVAYRKSPLFWRDYQFVLDWFSNALAVAEMPFPQCLDADLDSGLATAKAEKLFVSSLRIPEIGLLRERAARIAAQLRVAQTALALERYRLKHDNALPASLAALTPAFIEAVPADPFDGQPLRFRRLPDKGYVVYSIGTDRKDDNGTARPKDDQRAQPADITFTVPK